MNITSNVINVILCIVLIVFFDRVLYNWFFVGFTETFKDFINTRKNK